MGRPAKPTVSVGTISSGTLQNTDHIKLGSINDEIVIHTQNPPWYIVLLQDTNQNTKLMISNWNDKCLNYFAGSIDLGRAIAITMILEIMWRHKPLSKRDIGIGNVLKMTMDAIFLRSLRKIHFFYHIMKV